MLFRLSEILLLLGAFAAVLAPLAVAWFVLRKRGLRPTTLLSPPEWRATYKILAIIVFAVALHLTHLSLSLPSELFIYGRF
jgi:uncharacterized membrane protein